MKVRSRIHKPRARFNRQVTQRRLRCQPRLERLEERCVPASGIFVEDFSDDLDPSQPGFDSNADGFRIKVDAPSGSEIAEGVFGYIGETFSPPHILKASGLTVVTFPDLAAGDVVHVASIKVWGLSITTRVFSTTGESLNDLEVFEFQAVHHLLVTSASRSDSGNPLGPIARIEISGALDDIRVQVGGEPPVAGGVIFTENFSDDLEPDRPGFDAGLDGFDIRSTYEGGVGFIDLAALDIPQPDANQASSPWGLLLEPGDGHDGNLTDGTYTMRAPDIRARDGLLPGEEIALAKVSVYGNGSVTFTGTTGRTSTVDVFAFQGWQFVSRASGFEDESGLKLGGIVEIRVETSSFMVIDDVTVLIGTEQGTGEVRAFDDGYTVPPGVPILMDVLFNDVAPTRNKLLSAFTMPSHGTVTFSASGVKLIYVSDPNYHGIDTFDYTMEWFGGSQTGSDTGRVVLTVNTPPEADDETILISHEQALSGAAITGNLRHLGHTTFDGIPLRAILVDQPVYGSATVLPNGDFTFTSEYAFGDPGFVGDSFTFKFNDGLSDSNVATLRVVAPNAEPEVSDSEFISLVRPDGSSSVSGGLRPASFDADNDPLTLIRVEEPRHGVMFLEASGSFVYTPFPDAGLFGADRFRYRVSDGLVLSEVAVVTFKQSFGEGLVHSDAFTVHATGDREEQSLIIRPDELLANDRFSTGFAAGDHALELRIFSSGVSLNGTLYHYDASADPDPDDDEGDFAPIDLSSDPFLVARDDLLAFVPPLFEDLNRFTAGFKYDFVFRGDGLDPASVQTSRGRAGVLIQITQFPELDTDGVPFAIELANPAGLDVNHDGQPDAFQSEVAALPISDGRYVTLISEPGTQLVGVQAIPNPSPEDSPPPESFPLGFFRFMVTGLRQGTSTTVTLIPPPGVTLNSYYKYNPSTDPNDPGLDDPIGWYEFIPHPVTRIGAEPFDDDDDGFTDRVVLVLSDGSGRGGDQGGKDGVIVDPGGPAFVRPPTVDSVVINDGSPQRSMINRLTVRFSDIVTLGVNAFLLKRVGGNPVALQVTSSVVAGRTVAELTFAGPLADGDYQLKVRGAHVHSAAGFALDGNGDGLVGGNHVNRFFQMLGDADGDHDVDQFDRGIFRDAYKSFLGETRYRWYFDFDGDGQIDSDDRRWFKRSLGR